MIQSSDTALDPALDPSNRSTWIPDVPLSVLLSRGVQAHPETHMHFHTQEGVTSATTAELFSAAGQFARGLRAIGLRRGDAVAVQLPTLQETAAPYPGCAEIRAGAGPIQYRYRSDHGGL